MILTATALSAELAGGCYSADYDPQVRRQRLLEIYPPQQASREDVQQHWQPTNPEFTALWPPGGWADLDRPRVRQHIAASEQRTGRPVQRVDCYVGPDGMFGLCYCWFYYDEHDKVVDAEWQYHTD
jgi:hypothetical protein